MDLLAGWSSVRYRRHERHAIELASRAIIGCKRAQFGLDFLEPCLQLPVLPQKFLAGVTNTFALRSGILRGLECSVRACAGRRFSGVRNGAEDPRLPSLLLSWDLIFLICDFGHLWLRPKQGFGLLTHSLMFVGMVAVMR